MAQTLRKKKKPFKTRWYHRRLPYWFRTDRDRVEGTNEFPEIIRLDVEPGVTPENKPPVRIFLGTEPMQHRAERVFIWSVMKYRNPARVYEIHLMSDLAKINREGWKTGFSNYRYAIPTLAGGTGRAIYNDVDQVYIADPAELFDMDMDGAGILSITNSENSVMLIDCEKMLPIWNRDAVNDGLLHAHFKALVLENDLFRKLDGAWNARDGEIPVEQSKCIHYTTLHTQPWEPFPDQLRYSRSPVAQVWEDMEKEADEAGFK